MQLTEDTIRELCGKACAMREKSYVPYSHFRVGAALLTAAGEVYEGCNIENAAYTPTICAERTAFACAVSRGERDFAAIAICGGPEDGEVQYCPPCGVCRQVMAEFCRSDFRIFLARSDTDYRSCTLAELLPERFTPANLEQN